MTERTDCTHRLVSFGFDSIYSYELSGDHLTGRLFGVVTAFRIHLHGVHYLRLATRSEVPPALKLFNWINFLPSRRVLRPMYVLQTRSNHRIFLKLDGASHFRLRQAIGRHVAQSTRMAA